MCNACIEIARQLFGLSQNKNGFVGTTFLPSVDLKTISALFARQTIMEEKL
jgi:hypothetical protein